MIDPGAIFFFFITLILMGFFAGIEMAYYSASRLNIEIRKKQGGSSPQIVARFVDSPAIFLGVMLICFTTCLVFFALQLSNVMSPLWHYLKIDSAAIRLTAEIIVGTLMVLIFGEFIPRALFRAKSNTLISKLAHVIDFFYQLFHALAFGLINLSEWVLKYIFNVRVDKNKESLNRSDLKHLFNQGEADDRQERNTQLMENAQELPKVKIRQCLVPRKEIVGLESNCPIEEFRKKFIETKLSKLVVYESNIDHIIGYIHQLDMFKKPENIKAILLPIFAVPESMSATGMITKFNKERKSLAWVVDEFGGTAGIITMEDVLEELFGEIQDEYDTEEFVEKQLSDTEYIFSGRLELDYLEDKYDFEFKEEESETLSGYIISHHETIPQQKERIIIDDFEFDILNVSDTRIEMVKMKRLK